MPSVIDNAVAAIQAHVLAITNVSFKSAPDYPIENADPFPFSAGYISTLEAEFTNASMTKIFPVLTFELHFNRTNIKFAYQCINAVAIELPRRLAKDPTLGGTVSSIIATKDQRMTAEVAPFEYGSIKSQMLKFNIPFKTLQTPTT